MRAFDRLVDVAKAMKPTDWRKPFHVSFILRGGKVVAMGTNSYVKRNPICLRYRPHRHSLSKNPYIASIHSELAATAKIKFSDADNYTLVNIRINNNMELANACPCPNCSYFLGRMSHIRKIFYSNEHGTFSRFP